jgi:hypothetical protein
MPTKLKPCPFCPDGGKPTLEHKAGSWGYYSGSYYCICKQCGVKTRGYDDEGYSPEKGTYSVKATAIKSAIKVWNTRADETDSAYLSWCVKTLRKRQNILNNTELMDLAKIEGLINEKR